MNVVCVDFLFRAGLAEMVSAGVLFQGRLDDFEGLSDVFDDGGLG